MSSKHGDYRLLMIFLRYLNEFGVFRYNIEIRISKENKSIED